MWIPPQEAGARTGVGVGQLSHVNTNTNLRKENRTVHCSIKRGFHIMKRKARAFVSFFSKKESRTESGTKRAAHGIICTIIPHPKEGKTILILYSNKSLK